MKKIEAIIKPFKIDEVKIALEEVGVRGMTILDAQGRGRQRGFTEMNTGVEYGDFLPKVKLEVVVEDDLVDKSIDAIIKSTNTNRIGDGKIFVSNIEKIIRIRTRETGSEAL
jgi:nitrogen regulatory protein P-II 1